MTAFGVLFRSIFVVFVTEAAIMTVFSMINIEDPWLSIALDTVLLVTVSAPLVFFWAIRPYIEEQTRALKKATYTAERAERSKSEFLATMSHELRTPLNAVIGFSDSILHETFGAIGNPRYKDYARDIHHSGLHLLDLINDILDVSAIEAGRVDLHETHVDIADVIARAVRLIAPRADAGDITIVTQVPPNTPRVLCDARRMTQVVLNLLSNAVKFSPEGGEVQVKAEQVADGQLHISVTDQGIGMETKDIKTALQPFGQVHSAYNDQYEGTGLGLAISTSLVELHGGALMIESEKGRGTVVKVGLPADRVITDEAARGAAVTDKTRETTPADRPHAAVDETANSPS